MKKPIRIFTDGAGKRPDGKGSGIAWMREDTKEHHVERIDGLSNNEAEYRAVISALKRLPNASHVEILADSLLVVSQTTGEYRIRDSKLIKLGDELKTVVERKRLNFKVTWIPRKDNLAGKLL
jgi:ribonuclease HI